MDTRSIGVFDSGLGGLTAVKQIMQELPTENIVYFGDTGRVPYGTRSYETIKAYANQDMTFLKSKDVKMIVAACGTVSSVFSMEENTDFGVLYTGVLMPAAIKACQVTKNNKIGVIGTSATVKSGSYEKMMRAINEDISVYKNACPLFVPLVEEGYTKGEIARLVAEEYLKNIKDSGVDTLILGCTHYPLLKDIIREVMGEGVTLVDPGKVTANYVRDYLKENNQSAKASGEYKFFVSDYPNDFRRLASDFLQREIDGEIGKIDIEKYV